MNFFVFVCFCFFCYFLFFLWWSTEVGWTDELRTATSEAAAASEARRSEEKYIRAAKLSTRFELNSAGPIIAKMTHLTTLASQAFASQAFEGWDILIRIYDLFLSARPDVKQRRYLTWAHIFVHQCMWWLADACETVESHIRLKIGLCDETSMDLSLELESGIILLLSSSQSWRSMTGSSENAKRVDHTWKSQLQSVWEGSTDFSSSLVKVTSVGQVLDLDSRVNSPQCSGWRLKCLPSHARRQTLVCLPSTVAHIRSVPQQPQTHQVAENPLSVKFSTQKSILKTLFTIGRGIGLEVCGCRLCSWRATSQGQAAGL